MLHDLDEADTKGRTAGICRNPNFTLSYTPFESRQERAVMRRGEGGVQLEMGRRGNVRLGGGGDDVWVSVGRLGWEGRRTKGQPMESSMGEVKGCGFSDEARCFEPEGFKYIRVEEGRPPCRSWQAGWVLEIAA